MLTIEQVKKEYYRIEKLLNKEALTGDDYNANCQEGYSVYQIKKKLGLSWNAMKNIIGAKEASNMNHKGGVKKAEKIRCDRDGSMISTINCVPGCNDICQTCENRQEGNVSDINTTTPEEDRELNYTSSFGNSGALAANEGIYAD